jgi:hypothetical protein
VQPGAAGTLQIEVARPELSPALAVVFAIERTEEVASEASLSGMVTGQASAPVPPTPIIVGEMVPKEVLPQEG